MGGRLSTTQANCGGAARRGACALRVLGNRKPVCRHTLTQYATEKVRFSPHELVVTIGIEHGADSFPAWIPAVVKLTRPPGRCSSRQGKQSSFHRVPAELQIPVSRQNHVTNIRRIWCGIQAEKITKVFILYETEIC